ncbi:MAG: Rrf2 family transcriptional regulator [Christensenellaceae bacterium]|nr:Rrf2 family transcriptional regulator [Christensenellaceae bacterium]
MSSIYKSADELIGNTPLLELSHIEKAENLDAKIIAKLVVGLHGKGGGYRLVRNPEEYTVGEILRLTEGDLAPVACLSESAPPCSRAADCRTLPMWKKFYRITLEYFDGITLKELMRQNSQNDYVI